MNRTNHVIVPCYSLTLLLWINSWTALSNCSCWTKNSATFWTVSGLVSSDNSSAICCNISYWRYWKHKLRALDNSPAYNMRVYYDPM